MLSRKNKEELIGLIVGVLVALVLDKLTPKEKKTKNAKKAIFGGVVASTLADTTNQKHYIARFANGFSLYNLGRLSLGSSNTATITEGTQEENRLKGKSLGRVERPTKTKNIRLANGKIVKASYSRFFEPYYVNQNGKIKTTLADYIDGQKYTQKGVYIIQDNHGEVVYVGYSLSNLYGRLYRHFQKHSAEHATHVYSKFGYLVQVVQLPSSQQHLTAELEKYFIMSLQPRDNIEKYLFYQDGGEPKEYHKTKDQQAEQEKETWEDLPELGAEVEEVPF
ncbi:MAG: GIY-YIG nuclease family protein [Bacteroidota bacterium]